MFIFISFPACFRRVLAGKRISSHWVKKTLICERVNDCQLQCSEEKRFTCEGFNYRIDHTGNGQGVCELIESPLVKIDLYAGGGHNLQVHPDYDYYERDRNASPGCYQPPGCVDCAHKRPTTSRPSDIYRPYPVPLPPQRYPEPYPNYPQPPPSYGNRPSTAVDVYRPPSQGIYEHRPPLQRPGEPYYPIAGGPRPSYGNIDRVGIEEEYYKGGKPHEEPIYYGYPQKPPANSGYHTIPSQQPIRPPDNLPPQRPEYAPRPPLPPSSPDSHYFRPQSPPGSYGNNEPQKPAQQPYGPESHKPPPQPYLPENKHPYVAPPSPIAQGYGPEDRVSQNYRPDRPPQSYGPNREPQGYGPDRNAPQSYGPDRNAPQNYGPDRNQLQGYGPDRSNPSKPYNPYFIGGDMHNAWGMYGGTYGSTNQGYFNKAGADYWGLKGSDHRRQDGLPFNYFDLAGPRPIVHNSAYGMQYGGHPPPPAQYPQQVAGPPGYDDRGNFGQQWSRRPGVDGKYIYI